MEEQKGVSPKLAHASNFVRSGVTSFRDYGGFTKRVAARNLSKEYRRRMRQIVSGLQLPNTLPNLPKGAVAAVTMVKNEQDIIADTINHLLSQGVDYVLVADNKSTDSTPEILEELSRDRRVGIAKDNVDAYFQSEKMSNLARTVSNMGARWIIPFDADEFWYSEEGKVGEFLRASEGKRFPAKVHNAFPSSNGLEELWVDQGHEIQPKTAFRKFPLAFPTMGNHFAVRPGEFQEGLHVVHFPWRSKEQLRQKSRTGSLALKLANADAGIGSQWTGIQYQNEAAVDRIWESILSQQPDPVLGLKAYGPFRLLNPREMTTWTLPDV